MFKGDKIFCSLESLRVFAPQGWINGLVLRKAHFNSCKLPLVWILLSGATSKASSRQFDLSSLRHLKTIELTHCFNLSVTGH